MQHIYNIYKNQKLHIYNSERRRTYTSLTKSYTEPNMPFKHRYFLLRHGESIANVEKIVSSNPKKACFYHGLTEKGKEQAKMAGGRIHKVLEEDNEENRELKIYSSDFLRAIETASLAGGLLKAGTRLYSTNNFHENYKVFTLDERLRERNFGDFEATSNENYNKVWEKDVEDGMHTEFNVESVNAVRKRTVALVTELEKTVENPCIIVLSSHGDTLQILQTYFMNIPATDHRKIIGITNAEVREMKLGAPGFELKFVILSDEEFEALSEDEKEKYLAKKEILDAEEEAKRKEAEEAEAKAKEEEFVELTEEEETALTEEEKEIYLAKKEAYLAKQEAEQNNAVGEDDETTES